MATIKERKGTGCHVTGQEAKMYLEHVAYYLTVETIEQIMLYPSEIERLAKVFQHNIIAEFGEWLYFHGDFRTKFELERARLADLLPCVKRPNKAQREQRTLVLRLIEELDELEQVFQDLATDYARCQHCNQEGGH